MKSFKFNIDDLKEMALSKSELSTIAGAEDGDYSGPTIWNSEIDGGTDYCWDGACNLDSHDGIYA